MADCGVLLVPQKDLDDAKSRMLLPRAGRRDLAVAMLRRTLAAAAEIRFAAVLVVLDNPDDAAEVADLGGVTPFAPGVPGLNGALYTAERAVRKRWGAVPITVMPSDLPLATPDLLDRALRLASKHDRAFLPDISSTGTTLLFAGPDAELRPAYGAHSSHAHESRGAFRLENAELDLLRHDVDTLADLLVVNLRFEEQQRWKETA